MRRLSPHMKLHYNESMVQDRYRLDSESDVGDITGSMASMKLSPTRSHTSSSKKLSVILEGKSWAAQEDVLKGVLATQKTWLYPIYNEMAIVKYNMALDLRMSKDRAAAKLKERECLSNINNALKLVDSSSSDESIKKCVVYYNHSMLTSRLAGADKGLNEGALVSGRKAVEQYHAIYKKAFPSEDISIAAANSSVKEYMQDFVLQLAYVESCLGSVDSANAHYHEAYDLLPERFIKEYTKDSSGREIIFWAIEAKSVDWIEKLIVLKSGGVGTIDANALSDMDLSPFTAAIREECPKDFIKALLALGADPFVGDEFTLSPFAYAITYNKDDVVGAMLEYWKENGFREGDLEKIRTAIETNELSTENQDQHGLFVELGIDIPLVDAEGVQVNLCVIGEGAVELNSA